MRARTSFGGIVLVLLLAGAAAALLLWIQRAAVSQLDTVGDVVSQTTQQQEKPTEEISSETIVVNAIEEMVKAYQRSGKPATPETQAQFLCLHNLANVLYAPTQKDMLVAPNNPCAQLVAQSDQEAWKNSNLTEQVIAAAVAYASIEPEPLVALLGAQWNTREYPEMERAVLMGILARATYLVDRDAVAGRVSCKADFSCRMGEALSLRDQTIAFTPTIDGLPRYRVAFVTTKIQAAVGYQMYTYEVSSKNGTVGAVAILQ
jgi:hypothetical protein